MAAPPLALGNIIQTRVFCQQFGQVSINVQHWRVSAIAGSPALDLVPERWSALMAPRYKPMMSVTAAFSGVGASRLSPGLRSIEYYETDDAGPGTASGDPMPAQVAGMISVRTDNAGRRNRGRNYIPFPSTVFASNDESPDAGYMAFLLDVSDQSLTMAISDGGDTATLTRIIYPGPGLGNWDVTASTPRDKWATQRRRGDYGQLNSLPF